MELKRLPYQFTVCKLSSVSDLVPDREFWFAARTDEEISLVCKTSDCPSDTLERDDGWRAANQNSLSGTRSDTELNLQTVN